MMMRTIVIVMLCIVQSLTACYQPELCYGQHSCADKTSQTFMFTRPLFANVAMQQAGWHSLYNYKTNPHESAFQIIDAYEQSIDSQGTRNYFTFCEQSCLLVAGDATTLTTDRNIRAQWLGITDPELQGCICIDPAQQQYGLLFEYTVDLETVSCLFRNYWFDAQVAIKRITNNLHTYSSEQLIIDAFNQPDWNYAKLPTCALHKTGIEFIKLLLGKTYLAVDNFEINAFGGLCIPGSGSQNPEYLFAPFLGFNGHFGFDFGATIQINLSRASDCYDLCFFVTLDAIFLVSNTQKRTYDLKHKPWSRYLQFVRSDSASLQTIPGVQLLTLESEVHPYDMIDFSAGWRFMVHAAELELCYKLWGHGTERVHPTCPFPNYYGIAGTGFIAPTIPATASQSTISTLAENDLLFVPITINDIDCNSAQAQRAITHAIQASASIIVYNSSCSELLLNLGGYYERSQFNTALNQWGLWTKIGLSF